MKYKTHLNIKHKNIELFDSDEHMNISAVLSSCRRYRYSLTRIWNNQLPKLMFIMLNPSTADETNNDPTIRRCIRYAKEWGYGGLYVCNLFSYRATKPLDLLNTEEPIGEENYMYIKQIAEQVDKVICAWGNKHIVKKILTHQNPLELLDFISSKLYCIELSKDGTPKHPLYLKAHLLPKKIQTP